MPKKSFNGYPTALGDFFSAFRGKRGEVTPELYEKEMIKFIKRTDSEYIVNNFSQFINLAAEEIINSSPKDPERFIAKEYENMYPYELNEKFLVESNRPTKFLCNLLKDKCTKDVYINFCNSVKNPPENLGSKNAEIEWKMNRLKTIEALKPTGNAFTTFFKKLFNINGYNDKIQAYENTVEQIRNEIGNKMSDEVFNKELTNPETRFKSTLLNQETSKKKIVIPNDQIIDNIQNNKETIEDLSKVNDKQLEKEQIELINKN